MASRRRARRTRSARRNGTGATAGDEAREGTLRRRDGGAARDRDRRERGEDARGGVTDARGGCKESGTSQSALAGRREKRTEGGTHRTERRRWRRRPGRGRRRSRSRTCSGSCRRGTGCRRRRTWASRRGLRARESGNVSGTSDDEEGLRRGEESESSPARSVEGTPGARKLASVILMAKQRVAQACGRGGGTGGRGRGQPGGLVSAARRLTCL